ncbi:DUF2914 domain-containing protein [Bowmanella yangjiangensis]|uniref:DUF2914 domain-containing protein n=1 Tax=Bowmanella yangjiangensis TaxID=2811230 RepID=A0ABS3CX19_9ALTE|nr:DUF2914 domain-containing protein [Bowmanella yangjiangensis]MBN7820855.1 DUF2914 domain-containing protein [Bowmanella yangjiangensis]
MRNILLLMLALSFSFSASADIEQSQLTSGVDARQPRDDLGNEVFGRSTEVTQVYFYNLVTDMAGQQLTHKWLHEGELMAEVTLNIGSNQWRTWSSKRLLPAWNGNWQIQVWQGETLLVSKDFVFTLAQPDY